MMLSFFPRDVLDEILDLIESVSEGFPTYTGYLKLKISQSKFSGTRKFTLRYLKFKISRVGRKTRPENLL